MALKDIDIKVNEEIDPGQGLIPFFRSYWTLTNKVSIPVDR